MSQKRLRGVHVEVVLQAPDGEVVAEAVSATDLPSVIGPPFELVLSILLLLKLLVGLSKIAHSDVMFDRHRDNASLQLS